MEHYSGLCFIERQQENDMLRSQQGLREAQIGENCFGDTMGVRH